MLTSSLGARGRRRKESSKTHENGFCVSYAPNMR
jgi:hypothetical protein